MSKKRVAQKSRLVDGVDKFRANYMTEQTGRIFVYLFSEDSENEGKFGETYVRAGEDPLNRVSDRIKEQLTTGGHKWKNGTIACYGMWDVTELAIKEGRYRETNIHIDDFIRPHIGHVKPNSHEYHQLPVDEIKFRVDKFLAKIGAPLPAVLLNVIQADKAELFLTKIAAGVKVLLAEFCARFGKTIWAGVIVKETKIPLTVYTSYVLTSGTSIQKEIASYEQFKDIVFVDTGDVDYKERIDDALVKNKQVIAFLSLCNGANRQIRVDYLYNKNVDRITFVDEADFGAHRSQQSDILINAQQPNDVVILMTGTNPDRAASSWNIEFCDTVVYMSLLLEKRIVRNSYNTTLKHFTVDQSRNKVVVDAEFYQLNLARAVEEVKITDPTIFDDGGVFLPSWNKTAADPVRAKRFLIKLFENLFTHGNHDELNVDLVTKRSEKEDKRVAMMFFPHNTTNVNLQHIKNIVKDTLPGYLIVDVSGYNGLSGKEAEAHVKEAIEKAKMNDMPCLIIATQMAQRSFSIPEITELYLAYDNGDAGATTQRISRALTPGNQEKTAKIISLSFDPNRDDKYDVMVLETAKNLAKGKGMPIREALALVLKTIDIFKIDEFGERIKIEIDEYLPQLIEYSRISRVVGKVANIGLLSDQEIIDIAKNKVNISTLSSAPVTQSGIVRHHSPGGIPSPRSSGNTVSVEIKKVREIITTIAEHIDFFIYGANSLTVSDAIQTYYNDYDLKNDIESHMNITVELIDALFKRGVINADLLDLTV